MLVEVCSEWLMLTLIIVMGRETQLILPYFVYDASYLDVM